MKSPLFVVVCCRYSILQTAEENSMFDFGHIYNPNPTHTIFDNQKSVKEHMAAVKKCYLSGLVIRENALKASILFICKFHDIFLSKLPDHDREHSYHYWYGRLRCF